MTEAIIGGHQHLGIVRNDLDRISERVKDASVRELHIAKEFVLRTAE
jgi:hypothetical protein